MSSKHPSTERVRSCLCTLGAEFIAGLAVGGEDDRRTDSLLPMENNVLCILFVPSGQARANALIDILIEFTSRDSTSQIVQDCRSDIIIF